jgi:hypothetical protein
MSIDVIKVLAATGDDTVAPPVAVDKIAGINYQKIKTGWGVDGVFQETADTDGVRLPIGGAQLGLTNETAPSTDIAASGLNGRLQRIAQRLTALIAQIPATLGQKTMANSLAVVLASDQGAVPTSMARREAVIPWTVVSGQSISPAVDTSGYGNMGLIIPSTFDGGQISFIVSDLSAGTYYSLYDITGTMVVMNVVANRAYDLPGELMAWRFIRLSCTTTQTGDTAFLLVLRS